MYSFDLIQIIKESLDYILDHLNLKNFEAIILLIPKKKKPQ